MKKFLFFSNVLIVVLILNMSDFVAYIGLIIPQNQSAKSPVVPIRTVFGLACEEHI